MCGFGQVVVGGHRPIYVDSTFDRFPDGDLTVARDLQSALEEMLLRYRVDLTWHGHHHSYQRTCPLFRHQCMPPHADGSQAAPVHLVIGHAGAGLSWGVSPQPPSWIQVVKLQHGFMRVTANGTHFTCQVGRRHCRWVVLQPVKV